MLRSAPRLMVLFLTGSLLAGCATASTDIAKASGGNTAAGQTKKETQAAAASKSTPGDLDSGVRQAQLLRQAGQYDDAIRTLSQLMLVASDDPRVVAEYGKSLAEKGRAQDAVEFLNRAIELNGNDWTLYSALGVSYDQLGNQLNARAAYEHALALRPNDASVLNNYALSRMLANDPDGARILIAKAQAAGGGSDSKIAANIILLNKLAPTPAAAPNTGVAQAPAKTNVASAAPVNAAPRSAPQAPVAQAPLPPASIAQNAPRPLAPVSAPRPQQMASNPVTPSGVVMQAVPFDPYAGPAPIKLHPPKPKAAKVAETPKPEAQPAAAQAARPAPAKPVKTASKDQVPSLRLTADARMP